MRGYQEKSAFLSDRGGGNWDQGEAAAAVVGGGGGERAAVLGEKEGGFWKSPPPAMLPFWGWRSIGWGGMREGKRRGGS